MLSGIGSQAELKKLGLDPLLDLPVGLNLADNPLNGISVNVREPLAKNDLVGALAISERLIFFALGTEKNATFGTRWGILPGLAPEIRTPETLAALAAAQDGLSESEKKQLNQVVCSFFKVREYLLDAEGRQAAGLGCACLKTLSSECCWATFAQRGTNGYEH